LGGIATTAAMSTAARGVVGAPVLYRPMAGYVCSARNRRPLAGSSPGPHFVRTCPMGTLIIILSSLLTMCSGTDAVTVFLIHRAHSGPSDSSSFLRPSGLRQDDLVDCPGLRRILVDRPHVIHVSIGELQLLQTTQGIGVVVLRLVTIRAAIEKMRAPDPVLQANCLPADFVVHERALSVREEDDDRRFVALC